MNGVLTEDILRAIAGSCSLIQKGFVFRSKGNLGKQIVWYVIAFIVINCIVNSINCVWVTVSGLFVPDFIYNIGTTILNGGISTMIFFVNKIIFLGGRQPKSAALRIEIHDRQNGPDYKVLHGMK